MDQYIGKMLDNRYEILECIGNGGMAMVYKARDHRLNRLVAVKILKPELASDADFRRRFHDESQAVAMLSHANIVSVYDVSRSDGLDYIVMEMIDGLTLKQYMQRRGTPLNWREALHFITQIMRALSHAHSRGIIHRDIKPHNIMVLRDGSVKVTDFGIAQLTSAAQSTLTQEAIGSVHYISPEQARGSHVDCRTDIYSAGVVLYEMLTGRLPFEGDTPVGIAIQHINAIPVPPRSLNPDVPEMLETITMKAMAPSLDQRYGTADEMLEDLKEFRKNPDMAVLRPEPVDEPTTVVVPVRVDTAESADRRSQLQPEPEYRERRRPEPEEDEGDYDEQPRRSGSVIPAVAAIVVILAFIGGMGFFLYNFIFKGMFQAPKEYQVPLVLGRTVEELKNNKIILGDFELVVDSTVFSETYAEGMICDQSPEAGSTVREGERVITVKVSGGKDKMYMQPVTGWDAREALQLLQNDMGLNVDVQEEFSDTITEGYVTRFSPIEGMLVEKGDKATIWVSKGPETPKATVVHFVDKSLEVAKAMITELGLNVGEVKEFPDNKPAGTVIYQSVDAGVQVEKGTAIDLWVSTGPAATDPPVTEPPESEPPETNPPASNPPETNPPTTEPPEEPSVQPPATQEPVPTDVVVRTSTKPITVDLSGYERPLKLKIVVGDMILCDIAVDADSKTVQATASGTQMVYIYINEELADSYSLDFTQ